MVPPKEIKIKSDGNILTYKDVVKGKDGLRYEYVYTKSITKKGMTLLLSEDDINNLIKIHKQ